MVEAVIASTSPPSFLTASLKDSGFLPSNWTAKSDLDFWILSPRPGVSLCEMTDISLIVPSGRKPTIREILPPKPFLEKVSIAYPTGCPSLVAGYIFTVSPSASFSIASSEGVLSNSGMTCAMASLTFLIWAASIGSLVSRYIPPTAALATKVMDPSTITIFLSELSMAISLTSFQGCGRRNGWVSHTC